MKISNVSNDFSKNKNYSQSFKAIYTDPSFYKHNGFTEVVLDTIKYRLSALAAKHPDKDCFIIRGHHGDFTKASKFYFSEKNFDGTPNRPNIFTGLLGLPNKKVITQDEIFPEVECGDKFNYKTNSKAIENFFKQIEEGFAYIANLQSLKPEVLAKNPKLSGEELVDALNRLDTNKKMHWDGY